MLEQVNALIDRIFGGAPRRVETLEARIARLQSLAEIEEKRTQVLKERVEAHKKVGALREKILGERAAQQLLYSDLGVDSPQLKRQKQIRRYVYLGIAVILIIIIVKSCF
jgi:dynactin complex subunit